MNFTPRSVTVNENDPASVNKYRIVARYGANDPATPPTYVAGDLVVQHDFDANGQHSQDIPIGSTANYFSVALIGKLVKLYVAEIGPDGTVTAESVLRDAQGHEFFTVNELPNGVEGGTVVP